MKTYLRLLSLIAVMALPIAIWANVILKGHVTYQNGLPANNYLVYIQTDSSSTVCLASHLKYTNPNGIYQDTLVCNAPIAHVRVWILDCHNIPIYHDVAVTNTGIVETNFIVCIVEPCHARFNYSPVVTPGNLGNYHFNAQPSTVAPGDSIVKYHWTFGDGATGSTKDPTHIFAKPGAYTVCLTIVSKTGCADSICQTIVVPPVHCHAQFTYLPVTPASTSFAGNIHFNGATSTTSQGDTIVQYRWMFGDGASASTKDPYHTYTKPGTYQVCLSIVSKLGCTDSACINVVIAAPPPTTCSANFNFTDTGLNGHFNSAQINVPAGDSITTRTWTFGDGQKLAGNVASPVHHYMYGGNYQACLRVSTHLGCVSEFCKTVHIAGDSIAPTHEFMDIISLYPNPATTQFNTTIYSRYSNVDATLSIYDVYGTIKWTSKTVLSQGNNALQIPVSQLAGGPYVFKVSTIYGIDSKRFFKL